jgi:hypothetical protein
MNCLESVFQDLGRHSSGQRGKIGNSASSKQQGARERPHGVRNCPNDHSQTVTLTQEEFEEALKSGAPAFHSDTCDTDIPRADLTVGVPL